MLKKIKEIKGCENNLTSVTLRQQLYSIQYNPNKQKAAEFWDKFDEIVRTYNNIPNAPSLTEQEIRDAFYTAIERNVPQVQQLDFVKSSVTGKNLSYEELKRFLLQNEAMRKSGGSAAGSYGNVKAMKANTFIPRCYNCHDMGHICRYCTITDGSKKCYYCKEFKKNIAAECPKRPDGGLGGYRGGSYRGGGSRGFGRGYIRYENHGNFRRENESNGGGKDFKRKSSGNSYNNIPIKKSKFTFQHVKNIKNNAKTKFHKNSDCKIDKERKDQDATKGKGEIHNHKIFYNKIESKSNVTNVNPIENNNNKILAKFLADTGATEYLTNSKIIFKLLDENNYNIIKGANKDASADFKSEGVGNVEVITDNKIVTLNNVICAENLSENLLSLRKFADKGLSIYLDKERIDIFDPRSKKSFISGIYEKPYWVIEFEVNKSDEKINFGNKLLNRKIVAYLSTRSKNYEINLTIHNENAKTNVSDELMQGDANNEIDLDINTELDNNSQGDELNTIKVTSESNRPSFEISILDRPLNNPDETLAMDTDECEIEYETSIDNDYNQFLDKDYNKL